MILVVLVIKGCNPKLYKLSMKDDIVPKTYGFNLSKTGCGCVRFSGM